MRNGTPRPISSSGSNLAPVRRVCGGAFVYEYDPGDSWRHQVLVEQVRYQEDGLEAECVAGERACPPEDAGGVRGYDEKLAWLSDPNHEEHESTRRWIESMTGGPFDPDRFDLDSANRAIRAVSRRR